MFITPHTSFALWISTKVTDPILAFVFGLISHFILDMIPHGDDNFGDHKKGKEKFLYQVNVASIDAVLASALIYFYVISHPSINYWVLFGAVLGAWLPDLAWMIIEALRLNKLYWYVLYHSKIHNIFDWQYSLVYGVPFQILFTLVMLKLSF